VTHIDALRTRARDLLLANTRTAELRGRRYTFTVPSARTYPFQWFWDSCFHAIAWAHFDAERAAEELRALLAWQRADGFIPHVIFWDRTRALRKPWQYFESRPWVAFPWGPLARTPATTELIQPPVLAQAAERVFDAGGGEPFVREILPAVLRYYRWLLASRDPDDDGLISIVAPSESGLDYSPTFDGALGLPRDPGPVRLAVAMRRLTLRNKARGWSSHRILHAPGAFAVEDLLMNSCLVAGLHAAARLARVAGDEAGAGWAETQAARSLASLVERAWDAAEGTFWNLDGPYERPAMVHTVESLMPLMLRSLPRPLVEELVERQLTRTDRFWPRYPVPSVSLHEPEFRADSHPGGRERIWRGGSWINTNWFLVHGLRQHGFTDEAHEIRAASLELVERHGFREYFNPLSGAPGGAEGFGWSTLVIDM
jgi:glycogen debranching enzyme